MQLRYIRPFSQYDVGDLVEVPDGAAYDDFYLEPAPAPSAPATPVTAPPPPDNDPPADLPAAPVQFPAPKEM